jgi:hypothetical protein
MMKLKWLIIAITPLFVSGCFTGMRHYGEAWGGGSTTSEKVTTTTLDIVTFPIQAPVVVPAFVAAEADEHEAKVNAEAYKDLMPLLINDPALALKERWDTKNEPHRYVFIESFSNPKVKYTDALLREIYQTCSNVQNNVLSCGACSTEFLASHFDEAYEKAASYKSYGEIVIIVSNTNTPLELVEKVASLQNFPSGATMPAQHALNQRYIEAKQCWMPLLENDPKTALAGRWDIKNETRRRVFVESFSNPNVKYNDDLLEEIYQTCPTIQDDVFKCRACSKEFLTRHFDEKFQQSNNWVFQHRIDNLISNPNTPIELVEKVATTKGYPPAAAGLAQRILAKRKSEQLLQAITPSVSP